LNETLGKIDKLAERTDPSKVTQQDLDDIKEMKDYLTKHSDLCPRAETMKRQNVAANIHARWESARMSESDFRAHLNAKIDILNAELSKLKAGANVEALEQSDLAGVLYYNVPHIRDRKRADISTLKDIQQAVKKNNERLIRYQK